MKLWPLFSVIQVATALPGNAKSSRIQSFHDNELEIPKLPSLDSTSIPNYKPSQDVMIEELFSAISKANVSKVKGLIDAGVDVNRYSISNEQSPLLQAVIFDEVEIIRLLVQAGADIHFRDRFGNSVLNYAIMNKSYEIIEAILSSTKNNLKFTKAEESQLLFAAIKRGRSRIIRVLLAAGIDVNSPSTNGETPLMFAARQGHESAVRTLLESGANKDAVDNFGQTASQIPCVRQEISDLIQTFGIMNEAKLSSRSQKIRSSLSQKTNSLQNTPRSQFSESPGLDISSIALNLPNERDITDLYFEDVTKGNDLEATRLTDANFGVNRIGEFFSYETALYKAVILDEVEIVRRLVGAGADIHFRDSFGDSILSLAIVDKSYEIIEALLSAPGTNLNAAGVEQFELLSKAITRGNSKIILLLISAGIDVNAASKHGNTALMLAAGQGKKIIVRVLLENGANKSAIDQLGRKASQMQGIREDIRELIENFGEKSPLSDKRCSW